ncbi:MAG: Uma2 family endonuclease [Chloroflexi bacterium]|nr:Uma2 family endonuclease [Chloroflexota bacterium]
MVLEKQFISAEAYFEIAGLPEYEDRRIELVEGVVVEMSKPGGKHGQIAMRLSVRIGSYVEANNLGIATTGDTGFVVERSDIGRDTVRGLDIAFMKKGRVPDELPDSLLYLAPDLAVEVISPSNKASDIEKKIQQLLNAGTSVIWIVYPDLRTVTIHTADGATTLFETDTLTGGDVLPGFELRVGDIFPP